MLPEKTGSTMSKAAPAGRGTPNETRRRFTKLGIGAPVLMTLASRPVLAGNCLSNMLSGNLSDPDRGTCSKGWSPGGWGQPGGMIGNYSTLGAWAKAGFDYGTPKSGCTSYSDLKKPECYTGGTKLKDSLDLQALNQGDVDDTLTLREILTEESNSTTRHLVTAYLNASLSANDPDFQYILTKDQVIGLASSDRGKFLPLGYDVKGFLDSTWAQPKVRVKR